MGANLPGLSLVEEYKSAVPVALTGTTAEAALASFNIPGDLLGVCGEIEIEWDFSCDGSPNNKLLRLRLGGTLLVQHSAAPPASGFSARILIGLRNSAALQRTRAYLAVNGSLTSVAGFASAVDMSLDRILSITGQLTNAGDTLTLEKFRMRFYR